MKGNGRLTNVALVCLLALAFASGWVAFELSGQPARALLVIHAAAGVAIVLLVPWKSMVARRGLRRPRPLRWASLVLAAGLLVSLAFGFLHSFGRPDVGYLTALDFHVGAALAVVPFVVWHLLARPAKLRPADLSRRNFLRGAMLLGASALGVVALPGARRAPTGSFKAAYPIPTQWMFDGTPELGIDGWSLLVAGRSWTYDELGAFSDRVTAVRLHRRLVLRAGLGRRLATPAAAAWRRRHGQRQRSLGHRLQQALRRRRRATPTAGHSTGRQPAGLRTRLPRAPRRARPTRLRMGEMGGVGRRGRPAMVVAATLPATVTPREVRHLQSQRSLPAFGKDGPVLSALARKLRLEPNHRVAILNAPQGYLASLAPAPADVSTEVQPSDVFDVVQLFVSGVEELRSLGPAAIRAVRQAGL